MYKKDMVYNNLWVNKKSQTSRNKGIAKERKEDVNNISLSTIL